MNCSKVALCNFMAFSWLSIVLGRFKENEEEEKEQREREKIVVWIIFVYVSSNVF